MRVASAHTSYCSIDMTRCANSGLLSSTGLFSSTGGILSTAVSLLLMSGMACASPERLRVTGTAINPDTRETVYQEFHDISHNQHTVRYEGKDGQVIATKALHYEQGYNTPLYQLNDLRFSRQTGSEWDKGIFVIFRQEAGTKRHEKRVTPSTDLVIDAGFDHFIRSHWQELVDGKVIPFSFLLADPLLSLNMQMQSVNMNDSAITEKHADYHYFLASSRNHFIGWAIPDIHIAYDNNEQLLRLYHGPSNITDNDDDRQTVFIRYSYESLPMVNKENSSHE